VQRSQQIDHVVCRGARNVGLVIAKRRALGGDHVFQQMDRRKCSPVVGGMITSRRLDLELGPDLRVEIALDARGCR